MYEETDEDICPCRREEMIPIKVATMEQINVIDNDFQQFEEYVNQLYDTRQVEEQETIGLFDFQRAALEM